MLACVPPPPDPPWHPVLGRKPNIRTKTFYLYLQFPQVTNVSIHSSTRYPVILLNMHGIKNDNLF
jgi:hypothetical protein